MCTTPGNLVRYTLPKVIWNKIITSYELHKKSITWYLICEIVALIFHHQQGFKFTILFNSWLILHVAGLVCSLPRIYNNSQLHSVFDLQ